MQPIEVSFVVEPSVSPCPFHVSFSIDGTVLWQSSQLTAAESVRVTVPDSVESQPRYMVFSMQGKLPEHTELDQQGDIIRDHVISIRDFQIEGIRLQTVLESRAIYDHDFNGSSPAIRDEFFGIMGCNGEVRLDFTSPIFLWLLENA